MNVEWTSNAIRQLEGIYAYISKDSEYYARRLVDRFTARSIQILEYLSSGEMVPEFGDATIRESLSGLIDLSILSEVQRYVCLL